MRPEEAIPTISQEAESSLSIAQNEDLLASRARHFLPNAHHYHRRHHTK